MKKHILIGVTGGIAVYKLLDVVSKLRKLGYDMNTIMTENACEFVNPLSFETIMNNYVVTDTFARPHKWEVEHIALAKKTDLMLIAPATANIIGKIANGIADDMLSTTVMAAKCPVVIAPAMNTAMYENPIVQENIEYLKTKGYLFIEPESGWLACGDVGSGKLPTPDAIVEYITSVIEQEQDLVGKHVLVTAGPTIEPIDPMRYITNHSSGKMGYALATEAVARGAEVTLISGPTQLACPKGVQRIDVNTAIEMYEAVHEHFEWADAVIKTAAVADYRPEIQSVQKIKKDGNTLSLKLVPNPDILKSLGEKKKDKVLIGFAAETQNVVEYAKEKIKKKHLDFIVANNISQKGAGFKGDTNIATIITKEEKVIDYPQMTKIQLAHHIINNMKECFNDQCD
ncbi:MAG: bifunctional phosphopantothenoylcysteine decarboxylase/phosphopantothenate--cysteine ligase CoaBC [Cellulosilyticaceae bacterium]